MLDNLRIYAALGWPVHPVNAQTKAPMLTGWQLLATTDNHQIEEWHKEFPGCAWGSPNCAERSVLDVDPRHGGDKHLADLLAKHGPLPTTPLVLTGGGGNHYWLRFPPGTTGRSIAKSNINPDADSITLKAIGGQVVVPPSRIAVPEHEGRAYSWVEGCRPWEVGIAEAPAWLVEYWPAKSKTKGKADKQQPDNPWVVREATPDLLTHPGADKAKGEKRRPLLLQMLGVHLARKDSNASIMAMAEAWASRCKPPLEREEWLPHVERLCAKEKAKMERMTPSLLLPPSARADSSADPASELTISPSGNGDTDAERKLDSSQADGGADASAQASKLDSSQPVANADAEAPAEPDQQRGTASVVSFDKPTLSAEAYHGLLGEMLKAIQPETEADPAGILLGWLAILGNIVGRGAWVQVGPDRHHPALYVAIVGKTSGAKGIAWGVAKWPFVQCLLAWAKHCICNGVGSGPGLIERVRDEIRRIKLNKKTGVAEEVVVPGADDKRCLLRLDELAICFKLQRSDSSTLGETLLTGWGGEKLEVPNRADNALAATDYTISVIGDTQPGTLRKLVEKGMEAHNGWLNRFLWAVVESDTDLSRGGNVNVLRPFLDRLGEALAFAQTAGELQRDADADGLWDSVYGGLKRIGDVIPHTDRARPYVVRLSMLFALADSSKVIRQDHLRAALAVWGYCRESARLLFGNPAQTTEPDPLWLQVLNVIDGSPGINRKQMYAHFGNHLKADALDDALAHLKRSGFAYCQVVQAEGGGRPAECWYPCPGADGEAELENDTNPLVSPDPEAEASAVTLAKACELTNYLPGMADRQELFRSLAMAGPEPKAERSGTEGKARDGVIRPAMPSAVFNADAFKVAVANEPNDDTMTEAEFIEALEGIRPNKQAS